MRIIKLWWRVKAIGRVIVYMFRPIKTAREVSHARQNYAAKLHGVHTAAYDKGFNAGRRACFCTINRAIQAECPKVQE